MTVLTFLIVLVAAWIHFHIAGYFILPGLTIYVAAYVATLSMACVAAVASRDRHCVLAAAVLIAYFIAHHAAWNSADPVLWLAIAHIAAAAWFILYGTTRWEFSIGVIFLTSVGVSALTQLGVIPNAQNRPDVYIAWSHPDLTSILGHMASIALGLGAGDAGLRARDLVRRRPVAADYRRGAISRLARVAQMARRQAD